MNNLFRFIRNFFGVWGIKEIQNDGFCTEFWPECISARVANETNESPKGFVSYFDGGFGHRFFCGGENVQVA